MSGAEAAGLILAVLPLFISALEQYQEGLDPIKAFCSWERELPHYIRKLRNEHVHYEQNLRLLLSPVVPEEAIAELLGDPSGELWDDDLTFRLHEKLGDAYEAYKSTMADIKQLMEKLASKLDLEGGSTQGTRDLEAIVLAHPRRTDNSFQFMKRVKFGMSKKKVVKLLEELHGRNMELERFTERAEKLEPIRRTTSKLSSARRLMRIREYARTLHHVLVESWCCKCRLDHRTNLQLEQRHPESRGSAAIGGDPSALSFKVSFSSTESSWQWQECEIRVVEDEENNYAFSINHKVRPKAPKSVNFTTPPPTLPMAANLIEVKDICAVIRDHNELRSCIGFALDGCGKLRGVYPVQIPTTCCSCSAVMVSLQELLQNPPLVNGAPVRLTKRERYLLAVTLASSILQLHETPWMDSSWGAKDILFQCNPTDSRPFDIDRPYIAQQLMPAKAKAPLQTPGPVFKNISLLTLAVTLLELYFGRPCELQEPPEYPGTDAPANPLTVWAMAYQWTEKEKENLSAAFLAAVTHCLRCFGDPSSSLSDPGFFEAAVEQIVIPLRDELWHFLGKTGT